jgi:transposase
VLKELAAELCLKPGQWLVIDNATFYKGGRIAELIEQAGCHVLYLPPYSSNFNKIKRCWSWLKHHGNYRPNTLDF